MRPVKRRKPPEFDSFWLNQQEELPVKDSDLRLRSYACIEAMVKIEGRSILKAAVEVADVLGRAGRRGGQGADRLPGSIEGIRIAYYEVRALGSRTMPISLWFMDFLGWRDWVLSSDEFTISFALQKYQERLPRMRARRLAGLMIEMRNDPDQAARNAVWRESQQPGSWSCFVPEP